MSKLEAERDDWFRENERDVFGIPFGEIWMAGAEAAIKAAAEVCEKADPPLVPLDVQHHPDTSEWRCGFDEACVVGAKAILALLDTEGGGDE